MEGEKITTGNSDQKGGKKRLPRITGWVVILAGLTFGAGYLYYLHLEDQKVFIDTYYFRTLQEVAAEFNNNLGQLVSLHKYGESKSTIQSIFTTYQQSESDTESAATPRKLVACGRSAGTLSAGCEKGEGDQETDITLSGNSDTNAEAGGFSYRLEANRVMIRGSDSRISSVSIDDLLPQPSNDFVLYVVADSKNRVLSSTGGASGLSIIDTEAVSRAIQLRESQDWLKLATKQGIEKPEAGRSLPGYSTQIDVELTTGKSRLFVLPFLLQHQIGVPIKDGASQDEDFRSGGASLFLLGLQPEGVIDAYDNRRWNLSLLLLSLVALVFLWTVARLLMLSRHQPLGNGFYRITIGASYLTFILLAALLVAFAHKNSEIAIKQGKAKELIKRGQTGLSQDLYAIFSELDRFHQFYAELLHQIEDAAQEPTEKSQSPGDTAAQDQSGSQNIAGDSKVLPNKSSAFVLRTPEGLTAQTEFQGTVDKFREDLSVRIPETCTPTKHLDHALPPFSYVNIFGSCTDVKVACVQDQWEVSESFKTRDKCSLPADGRLLLVFLMNKEGRQILPAFYYAENNKMPESYPLAHRDYFRRVRDKAGWAISLKSPEKPSETSLFIERLLKTMRVNPDQVGGNITQGDSDRVTEANFYIQRLLNINTGTRGSTIGMPLRFDDQSPIPEEAKGAVLGADIELPSLSLTEWDDPELIQDMVVMVMDRVSGQVLYHMDRNRSMVENLYQAGRGTAKISQSIRSGRFKPVPGYYHGASGEFVAAPLPISQWAMVVFIPDSGTDSLMTNTFLVSAIGMAAILFLLAGLLALLRRCAISDWIKQRCGIPAAVDRYGVMLYTSILISAIYVAFWLGEIIGLQRGQESQFWSWALCVAAIAGVLSWGYSVLRRLRRHDRSRAQLQRNSADILVLFAVFASIGLGLTFYLHHIGNKPDAGLNWYYRSLHEARLNQEARELSEIALTRFPNSIKLHRQDPLSLMPISDGWRRELSNLSAGAREQPRRAREHVLPEHVGTFSQYTSATDWYEWIGRYMLGLGPTGSGRSSDDGTGEVNLFSLLLDPAAGPYKIAMDWVGEFASHILDAESRGAGGDSGRGWSVVRFVIVYAIAYLLLCAMWHLFYRWVISARLLGPPGLTRHLKHIVDRNVPERDYDPRPELVLDLRCGHHAGYDLSALLLRCSMNPAAKADNAEASGSSGELESACSGVAEVLRECPWLKSEEHAHDWFPGARISFGFGEDPERRQGDGKRGDQPAVIRLSDLDICLSDKELRRSLLRLIRHLKAKCLAGELAELRLNLGFHSYEALLLKAHNIESDQDPMTSAEFADWAETLMDFTVDLPKELTEQVDSDFVDYECGGSGLLQRLADELPGHRHGSRLGWRRRRRWLGLRDADKTSAEWATINCILLKAGALFRHKWESCSGAEKLALYFLAKRKHVNTANAQLLEQLALQGLIRVDHGAVHIVNNSFAYFARHAEDTSTLKDLVDAGGIGAWQDYRLPVTLVVLLLLGGIAFTSGSSLYVIAASLLGLLATIGSLTSSAHMIRENLR